MVDRRDFLKILTSGVLGTSLTSLKAREAFVQEARYYNRLNNDIVECELCPNKCLIRAGEWGDCEVRKNIDGRLKSFVYGRLCSVGNDPIEKKPLFHFLPGTNAISVATPGCNLHCRFCQNWKISQAKPDEVKTRYYSPEQLVDVTQKYNTPTIAYTYTEPTVFYEYMYDTAKAGKARGVKNVMISAGYISKKPLEKLCQVLDGIKIDLKSFSNKFYKNLVSGELQPVLDTLKTIKENDCWLEIVYLVIPTHNDDMKMIGEMTDWLRKNLGPNVPLHFTRFSPQYLMKNLPSTPVKTLERAYETAKKAGLNYVYIGNVPEHEGADTYCPNCETKLIDRNGFMLNKKNLDKGTCPNCGNKIPGVWG